MEERTRYEICSEVQRGPRHGVRRCRCDHGHNVVTTEMLPTATVDAEIAETITDFLGWPRKGKEVPLGPSILRVAVEMAAEIESWPKCGRCEKPVLTDAVHDSPRFRKAWMGYSFTVRQDFFLALGICRTPVWAFGEEACIYDAYRLWRTRAEDLQGQLRSQRARAREARAKRARAVVGADAVSSRGQR
jgi:hypothetical protein